MLSSFFSLNRAKLLVAYTLGFHKSWFTQMLVQ